MATALVGLGYRDFAVISGLKHGLTQRDRTEGFAAGLADAGIELSADRVLIGEFTRDAAYALTGELLRRNVAVDAVFAVNDAMALGVLTFLRDSGDPKRVAVAGFDDIKALRDVTPALTTVRLPWEQVAEEALAPGPRPARRRTTHHGGRGPRHRPREHPAEVELGRSRTSPQLCPALLRRAGDRDLRPVRVGGQVEARVRRLVVGRSAGAPPRRGTAGPASACTACVSVGSVRGRTPQRAGVGGAHEHLLAPVAEHVGDERRVALGAVVGQRAVEGRGRPRYQSPDRRRRGSAAVHDLRGHVGRPPHGQVGARWSTSTPARRGAQRARPERCRPAWPPTPRCPARRAGRRRSSPGRCPGRSTRRTAPRRCAASRIAVPVRRARAALVAGLDLQARPGRVDVGHVHARRRGPARRVPRGSRALGGSVSNELVQQRAVVVERRRRRRRSPACRPRRRRPPMSEWKPCVVMLPALGRVPSRRAGRR